MIKENSIVWEKPYGGGFTLTFWKKTKKCECKGCKKRTHLFSSGPSGLGHPICEEHLKELMAYHIAVGPNGSKPQKRKELV